MTYNPTTQELEFSDGKKIEAEYYGFVGIGTNLIPRDTYTDMIEFCEASYDGDEYLGMYYISLSDVHKKELAEYMIGLWKSYGNLK